VMESSLRSILHIGKFYPPHKGGMESHVRDLAVRQARSANVHVIVASSCVRRQVSEVEGVRITRLAKVTTVASMPVCPELPAAIRRSPADIVHIHLPNPGAALAFLLSGHRGKVVITHHADTLGRKSLRRMSDPFVISLMNRASRIIVTSTRYLASSVELEPFREKCRVIPLGIDPVRIAKPDDKRKIEDLRRHFGERFLLAVGRLVPYKGFDVLIRAMKYIDANLLLIGSGPLAIDLAVLAATEGVERKVSILKHVDDLGPYLAAASLLVLPSVTRAEAFGLVQLEAMAAGLPVINTDIDSGVPEVSISGETGLTVPRGDVSALANAIQLVLDQEDVRRKFGAAAQRRFQAEFTADLMAERTNSVYEEASGVQFARRFI
jgi:glycosyltransferase involved in cell wall biosynthesis